MICDGSWRLAGSLIPGLAAGAVKLRVEGSVITVLETTKSPPPDDALTVLPLLNNSHDHGRGRGPVLTGHLDEPLERWLAGLAPSDDQSAQHRWVTQAARSLLASGVGAAVWCVNLHTGNVDREVAEACRASLDAGIRAAVVYPVTDKSELDVFDRVEELAAKYAGPSIDLQLGPVNPQWVPEPMLTAVAENISDTGRGIHMHLLETPAQRAWADAQHPEGIVTWLDTLGLLGTQTTLAHGTHLRPEEMALLNERGCCLALNASSNLRLASGIAPVAAALSKISRTAMGIDGMSLNDDADAWTELRLLRGLAQGQTKDKWPAETLLATATDPAKSGLGRAAPGPVVVGSPADFVLVDTRPWRHLEGRPGWTPAEIALCALDASRVREVWVAGRRLLAA